MYAQMSQSVQGDLFSIIQSPLLSNLIFVFGGTYLSVFFLGMSNVVYNMSSQWRKVFK